MKMKSKVNFGYTDLIVSGVNSETYIFRIDEIYFWCSDGDMRTSIIEDVADDVELGMDSAHFNLNRLFEDLDDANIEELKINKGYSTIDYIDNYLSEILRTIDLSSTETYSFYDAIINKLITNNDKYILEIYLSVLYYDIASREEFKYEWEDDVYAGRIKPYNDLLNSILDSDFFTKDELRVIENNSFKCDSNFFRFTPDCGYGYDDMNMDMDLFPVKYKGKLYKEIDCDEMFLIFYHGVETLTDGGGVYMSEGSFVYPDGSMD